MLKKFLPFALTFAFCGLVLVGCEEDVVSGDNPSMKAEVDGDDWETSSVAVEGDATLVITGAKADGSSIILTIPSDATIGTHDIPSFDGFIAAYRPDAQSSMVAMDGEITISTLSATEIVGSFEFTATDGGSTEVTVDNGSFYAKRN